MKIVVCEEYGPPETLKQIELTRPEPAPGEVLVRVTATGVGYVDGLLIQGLYQVKPPLPFYPCSEFAGVVEQVGQDVAGLSLGDRVFGMANGALADYVCPAADRCFPTPDSLTDGQAAGLFINYLTAVYGLQNCGDVQPNETMLVLGAAGGVGSAAIAVGKAMGLQVIAAASSQSKREAALANGADAAVDYSQPDWRAALKTIVPNGIDVVYDPVGGDVAEPALRSLNPGGRFLVVGFASGAIPKIALNLALLKRCAIVGVDWGGEARANPDINGQLLTAFLDLLNNQGLRVADVAERPAETYVKAFTDQLAGQITGKLVLVR